MVTPEKEISPPPTSKQDQPESWAWLSCPCKPDGSLDVTDAATAQFCMTRILALSPAGLVLILARRPALHMLVNVELQRAPQVFAQSVLARVVQSRPYDGNGWLTSCEFVTPFQKDAFHAWLRG
jgi:hypothetical protein